MNISLPNNGQKFNGLIPSIIQNSRTGSVLMLGYMNQEAFQKTLKTKKIWFYSRSKKRLWMKGEASGNILKFVEAKIDCDKDALLISALPTGPVCHTGSVSCFGEEEKREMFEELYQIIQDRKEKMPQGSYTTSLFRAGMKKICQKIKEESSEVIVAAKNESKRRLIEESVDLLYHLFVLLGAKQIPFKILLTEMKKRRTATHKQ